MFRTMAHAWHVWFLRTLFLIFFKLFLNLKNRSFLNLKNRHFFEDKSDIFCYTSCMAMQIFGTVRSTFGETSAVKGCRHIVPKRGFYRRKKNLLIKFHLNTEDSVFELQQRSSSQKTPPWPGEFIGAHHVVVRVVARAETVLPSKSLQKMVKKAIFGVLHFGAQRSRNCAHNPVVHANEFSRSRRYFLTTWFLYKLKNWISCVCLNFGQNPKIVKNTFFSKKFRTFELDQSSSKHRKFREFT